MIVKQVSAIPILLGLLIKSNPWLQLSQTFIMDAKEERIVTHHATLLLAIYSHDVSMKVRHGLFFKLKKHAPHHHSGHSTQSKNAEQSSLSNSSSSLCFISHTHFFFFFLHREDSQVLLFCRQTQIWSCPSGFPWFLVYKDNCVLLPMSIFEHSTFPSNTLSLEEYAKL